MKSTLISSLFFATCPTAIFRGIRSIVVDAVNGFACRAWPHISEEVHEGPPAFADPYAAASVIWIANIARIITTSLHCLPAIIFKRTLLGMSSLAMLGFKTAGHFPLVTATGMRSAISKTCPSHPFNCSAVALAAPKNQNCVSLLVRANYGPSVERLTSHINKLVPLSHIQQLKR